MFLLSQTNKSSVTGPVTSSSNPFNNIQPGIIIAVIAVSFILSLIIFTLLVEKKKAPRGRFLKWLREYLNFRSILIAGLIKFTYLFLATVLTAFGFVVMFSGQDETLLATVGIGLAIIILGNILLRLILEMTMIMIGLWENTSDIRAVLVEEEERPEEKPPKEPKEPKESKESEESKELNEPNQVDQSVKM